jgi:hypothetical protein
MHTSVVGHINRGFVCIFFLCVCSTVVNAQAWLVSPGNSANIYNPNTGNVGIGTNAPKTLLDVNGLAAAGGQNANLGLTQVAAALPNLQGSGKMVLGWNATGGKCESDFVTNTLGSAPGGFFFWNYNSSGALTNIFNITGSGSVGIGTMVPAAQFESYNTTLGSTGSVEMARFSATTPNYSQLRVTENRFVTGTGWTTASTRIQAWTDASAQAFIDFNPNGNGAGIAFGAQNAESMRILVGGNVLIGKTSQTNTGYVLDVNGNGRLNEVVVNATGADYVFDPGYRLSSLHDLERYVVKEHHLPGIVPAAQMQQEGVNLGDNQTRLLAKIEELTLYLIQQDKETQALKEKIKTLEERNQTLENLEQRIEKLEQRDKSH